MSDKPIGRSVSMRTASRQVRRALNGYAGQLAEKALARALAGDGAALQAVVAMFVVANAAELHFFPRSPRGSPAPRGGA